MTATGYEGCTDCNQRCVQSLKKKREVMKEERKQERCVGILECRADLP